MANLNKELIALFSGQASMVTTPKVYIKLTGGMTRGNVLNQCVYYSNKSELKDGWFWRSYKEWMEDICISERTLRRVFTAFEKEGWISKRTQKIKGVRTLIIRPNMDKIQSSLCELLAVQKIPQAAKMTGENACTKVAPNGQNDRRAKRPKCPNLSIEQTRSSNETTTDKNHVVVFDSKKDKELITKLETLPKTEKSTIQLLKEIKFHIDKYFPKAFWKGFNSAFKLLREGKWSTPTGFVDQFAIEAEKANIKAKQVAQEQFLLKETERRAKQQTIEYYKNAGKAIPDWCLA